MGADRLGTAIISARHRIRYLLTILIVSRSILIGSGLACLLVGLSKFRIIGVPSASQVFLLLLISVLIGLLIVFLHPLSNLDVAKMLERRTDMKERFSSALELNAAGSDANSAFLAEQLSDSELRATEVNIKIAFPSRVPWELPVGLALTILIALLYLLPNLPYFMSPGQKQDIADVTKQGIAIIKLAKATQKTANQKKLDETKKAAEEACKLGEAMEKGKLTKKQSLIEMQKLTQKMEETQKKLASSMPQKSIEQAKTEFKRSLDQKQQEELAQQQKKDSEKKAQNSKHPENSKKPGEKSNPEEQKKESIAMKQAKQALQQMAQALADQNTQQMQQSMEKIAQQMESGQMSKPERQQLQEQLKQLANALKNSNMDASAKQLEQLAQQMSQSSGNMDPNTLQQMAQMMKNIGKGMGKGQGMSKAELDMKTMGELAEAMKNGRLAMCMGKGFGKPGSGGAGAGRGYNGSGHPAMAMKDPGNTNPRLMAMAKAEQIKAQGKAGSAKEFAKYLSKNAASAKHLPNGKITGTRSQNGNELQISMTGDPEPTKSNAPYYQVYQTSKRAAESALNKENIPATYKKQVRDYFDSIQP